MVGILEREVGLCPLAPCAQSGAVCPGRHPVSSASEREMGLDLLLFPCWEMALFPPVQ